MVCLSQQIGKATGQGAMVIVLSTVTCSALSICSINICRKFQITWNSRESCQFDGREAARESVIYPLFLQ